MSYGFRFVAAVIGLLVMAILASRQLYLFAVLRDARGLVESQGSNSHMGLAISAGIAGCVAAGLMFYFFRRLEGLGGSHVRRAVLGTPLTINSGKQSNSSVMVPFDAVRWQRLNPKLSEGQADDRAPVNGSVAASTGSAAEQRSFARRSHQIMYKKWSQARHYKLPDPGYK